MAAGRGAPTLTVDKGAWHYRVTMHRRTLLALLSTGLVLLAGCEQAQPTVLERDSLFSLGIGRLEDQIDLFTADGVLPREHTQIVMRDGFIFVSNGAANKVMEFTSFGDLVRLIYNSQENPAPVTVGEIQGSEAITRVAVSYPFVQLGTIAVDSRRHLYAEDRLAPERSTFDETLGVTLNRIIVRFDDEGRPIDYLGQEGIGGTPFPHIERMSVTARDELVVVSATSIGKVVHMFAPSGELMYSLTIGLDRLPIPAEDDPRIPVLAGLVASPDAYRMYLAVSYYRTALDVDTGREYGITFDHSRIYWINLETGRYEGWFELPAGEPDGASDGHYDLVGVARGEHIFLVSRIDETQTRLIIVNDQGRVVRRRSLNLTERELVIASLDLTHNGVLTALLGYPDRADVLWWRTDRLLPGAGISGDGAPARLLDDQSVDPQEPQ